MNTVYFLLWLEGPFQSWGAESKFYRRETFYFPTKSAILGMLCAARGAQGKQCEFLSTFSSLKQTVLTFIRHKDSLQGSPLSAPLMEDYHMVGSGYDNQNSWEELMIPKTSMGKKPNNVSGAKITRRYYLQDHAFGVALEVPQTMVLPLKNALLFPVWDLYLGRKCCAPTEWIYQGTFSEEREALQKAQHLAKDKSFTPYLKVVEGKQEHGHVLSLKDVPICFGPVKEYSERWVTLIPLL